MIEFSAKLTSELFDKYRDCDTDEDTIVEKHPLGQAAIAKLRGTEDIAINTRFGKIVLKPEGAEEEDGEVVAWNYSSDDNEWNLKIFKN